MSYIALILGCFRLNFCWVDLVFLEWFWVVFGFLACFKGVWLVEFWRIKMLCFWVVLECIMLCSWDVCSVKLPWNLGIFLVFFREISSWRVSCFRSDFWCWIGFWMYCIRVEFGVWEMWNRGYVSRCWRECRWGAGRWLVLIEYFLWLSCVKFWLKLCEVLV